MSEKKEKKYIIDNPVLMAEWNWKKNNELGLDPKTLTVGSNKKAWWKCNKGHEWQATIKDKNNGHGCPYCSNKRVLQGYNDLKTINPKLAKEWNYEKNGNLRPENFFANSNKKVWWICKSGHEWQATIDSRNNGRGCPYCSGKTVLKGYNDLQTINPSLAREWNCEKNGELKPENFTANSGKKVWWICDKGHEWQATINHRNNGRGCPVCDLERKTSLPEYALVYYLRKQGLEVIHSYKGKGYETDIYIPTKRIAIEFDGYFWHKNRTKKDLEKNLRCKKDGIKLYRIRDRLPSLNDTSIDYIVQEKQNDLQRVFKIILNEITNENVDVDLDRDNIDIENLRVYTEKEISLLISNPEVAKEWNYEKNGNLRPESFFANSNKKVWWKCNKGHEWQAKIINRNKGTGCPYCSGQKVFKGYNDLQTINPSLAKEWNYERNGDLKPESFTANSGKKIWWKCSNGHEWRISIKNRNNGSGCPYCSRQKILKGYNDLETINPNLAKEWNYEKNGDLKPENFTANSHIKVWWKCEHGHEWQAIIASRNNGRGCPYCAGQKVLKGYNDLATLNPKITEEWNYEKNGDLKPENFTAKSGKKVWWKCSNGHEWQARIFDRNNGNSCPYCSGRKKPKQ